jgi:molecular chaperone DnaK
LNRPSFVRPTFWEVPMPADPQHDLPPEELRRLHFQRIQWAADASGPPPAVTDEARAAPAGQAEVDLRVRPVPEEGGTVRGAGRYAEGERVELAGKPAAGWRFEHWSGDLSGSANPAELAMDDDKTVVAHFAPVVRKARAPGTEKRVIGIDLGTASSTVAYVDRNGQCVTIPSAEGSPTTPSAVFFAPDGTVVVGQVALAACQAYPDRAVRLAKRDLGGAAGDRSIDDRQISPMHVCSLILKKLGQDAARIIGPPAGAVITIPGCLGEAGRQAVVDAGTVSGLNVLDVLDEPTAAALAYRFHDDLQSAGDCQDGLRPPLSASRPETVLVYDLGGGVFDAAAIHIHNGALRVLGTRGDLHLGGREWDDRIVDHAAEQFLSQHGTDPRGDPHSYQRLLRAAEEAKMDLSLRRSTQLSVLHQDRLLVVPLDREQFEAMTRDLLSRTKRCVEEVLHDARRSGFAEIDRVLLAGGASRMPQVSAMISRVLKREPDRFLPHDTVAHGAAIHAAVIALAGQPSDRSAAVATRPDLASIAAGYEEDVVRVAAQIQTLTVSPHSLGVVVQTPAGRQETAVVIPRNTPLPASREKIFGTVADGQKTVRIRVLEGESPDPAECTAIGECVIGSLPGGLPRGSPIRVTFRYDSGGRLNVEATVGDSGESARTTIIRENVLSGAQMADARDFIRDVSVS